MKHIKNINITHQVPFCNDNVDVKELSIFDIEEMRKELSESTEINDLNSFDGMLYIIQSTVVGAEKMTVDDLKKFPIKQLTNLVQEVLKINGLVAPEGND